MAIENVPPSVVGDVQSLRHRIGELERRLEGNTAASAKLATTDFVCVDISILDGGFGSPLLGSIAVTIDRHVGGVCGSGASGRPAYIPIFPTPG